MKTIRNLVELVLWRVILVLSIGFFLAFVVFPTFAQEEPTIVPNGTLVVETFPIWAYLGWIIALFLFLILVGFVWDKAREGNRIAQLGLMFFEAAKTMVPLDDLQRRFEEHAALTPTPLDDFGAGISGDILERLNNLESMFATQAQTQQIKPYNKEE